MRKIHILYLILTFPLSDAAFAQDKSRTVCHQNIIGELECETTTSSSNAEVIRRSFEQQRTVSPNPGTVLNDKAITDTGAGIVNSFNQRLEAQRAAENAQSMSDEQRVAEVRRAILADPSHAEEIAQLYGVRLSSETLQAVERLRSQPSQTAIKVQPNSHQQRLQEVRLKVEEANGICQEKYVAGTIKTLSAKTDCSRALVMPMVKSQKLPTDIYEAAYTKIKALARKVDKGQMTIEQMAQETITIDRELSEQIMARLQ